MASSTIFWVFGMTRPRIEPRSPESLANTLTTMPMSSKQYLSCIYWPLSTDGSQGQFSAEITLVYYTHTQHLVLCIHFVYTFRLCIHFVSLNSIWRHQVEMKKARMDWDKFSGKTVVSSLKICIKNPMEECTTITYNLPWNFHWITSRSKNILSKLIKIIFLLMK